MPFKSKCLRGLVAMVWVLIILQTGRPAARAQDYQALSLEDCLALARQYNPVLGASREKIQELLADYQAARSKFFPRLVLLSYYDRQPPNRFSPGGGLTNLELFKREGLTAVTGKQVIFDGLKTYYNTQAAKIGSKAQKEEVQRTAEEVAFTVTEAFYRFIEARENLKVARETLQQRQGFAKLTEGFFKAGKVTHLDSFRAQSQVSEAEQAGVEAENAVRLAREILARTLGLHTYTVVGLTREAVSADGEPIVYLSLADAQEIIFQRDNEEVRNQRERLFRTLSRQSSLSPAEAERLLPRLQPDTHIVNAILVSLGPGADRAAVARQIERWLYFSVFTTDEEVQLILK